MSDLLNITKTNGTVLVLHLEGKLDGQTEADLLEIVHAEFDAGARSLVLDLEKLEMITSAGLRALHTIYKMFTPDDQIQKWKAENPKDVYKSPYFKLAAPSSQIHYILSMAGFLQSLYIFPTNAEALASFS